jgi:hypothetical protein
MFRKLVFSVKKCECVKVGTSAMKSDINRPIAKVG